MPRICYRILSVVTECSRPNVVHPHTPTHTHTHTHNNMTPTYNNMIPLHNNMTPTYNNMTSSYNNMTPTYTQHINITRSRFPGRLFWGQSEMTSTIQLTCNQRVSRLHAHRYICLFVSVCLCLSLFVSVCLIKVLLHPDG